nr:unnamed protein product [Callosobruchus analis]
MTCLPFGLASAPLAFARVSNWMASKLRERNMRVVVYLDDFVLVAQDPVDLERNIDWTVRFLLQLGWKINLEKSNLTPSQTTEFLGIGWDTQTNQKFIPQNKISLIRKRLQKTISSGRWSLKQAKSVIGSLNFVSFVISVGRLHCRRLQIASKVLPEWAPKTLFPVPQAVLKEMYWWLTNLEKKSEIFHPAPQVFLTTDASNAGWGAHIMERTVSGTWTSKQTQWHINLKEMSVIYKAILLYRSSLVGKTLLIQSDNQTVVAYIRNQGGTKSKPLLLMTERIYHLATLKKIRILIRYIPGIVYTTMWRITYHDRRHFRTGI